MEAREARGKCFNTTNKNAIITTTIAVAIAVAIALAIALAMASCSSNCSKGRTSQAWWWVGGGWLPTKPTQQMYFYILDL